MLCMGSRNACETFLMPTIFGVRYPLNSINNTVGVMWEKMLISVILNIFWNHAVKISHLLTYVTKPTSHEPMFSFIIRTSMVARTGTEHQDPDKCFIRHRIEQTRERSTNPDHRTDQEIPKQPTVLGLERTIPDRTTMLIRITSRPFMASHYMI